MSCYGQVDVAPFVILVYLEVADLKTQGVSLKFCFKLPEKLSKHTDILSFLWTAENGKNTYSQFSKFRSCGICVEGDECLRHLLTSEWTCSPKKEESLPVNFSTCWEFN